MNLFLRLRLPGTPRPDSALIQDHVAAGRIAVERVRGVAKVQRLMEDFGLGRGEAEALELARERRASLVATDDRNAIVACRLLGLRFAAAIDFLVRARQKQAISKEQAKGMLEALAKHGRYGRRILDNARRQTGG